MSSLMSSVISWLLSSVLFSLHAFVFFTDFYLSLISSLIALWSEKTVDTISIFLNLPRLDL